ncbi:HAMP domain-containing sensor histidine kinase [Plantactinospora sp. BB1]|uniref:sensor histidine kinase n=1 Tax=Plantactinospora sp. BB1 TaxID=2071627 RepID=UPI000D168F9D|nr:HAMP domain-containing sensor histidine kinase [Plantactinospora sp. BB1]AVT37871.1 two-component sensor histidine kinase [Plantactinospora sp. BB1]
MLSPLRWPPGLRVRLLLAFVSLGLTTTAVVAGAGYVRARNVILQTAQDAAVVTLKEQVTQLAPIRTLPPSQADLDAIAAELSGRDDTAIAAYQGRSSAPDQVSAVLPPELRSAVASGRVVWQRQTAQGFPYLVIGTQVMLSQPDGTARPSGLEIYRLHSLEAEQRSIDRLAASAWSTGALSLALAVVLALLAARGVLRPVRELDRAARRLGDGDLSTRLAVRGSDELARVADTFNHTAQQLERQVGELRRMEADARRFVADVSHELRTPLAAMTAVTDVLDEEAPRLPGDAGRAARLVSQETQSLTRLVDDLIEVSRFDSGTAALALDDVDVPSAVRATLRARGWTERVVADLPPDTRARLDPRRLDVILANLVGNALRHGAPPVTVRLRAEPDWIVLTVGDRGPGLDPLVLPHVFDRFYKADSARSRSEGSGLGLAIAWENARLHRAGAERGSLVAGNDPAGGAVFTLRLPRRCTDPAPAVADRTGSDGGRP